MTATGGSAAAAGVAYLTRDYWLPQIGTPSRIETTTEIGQGYRFDRNGWVYVHIEGDPHERGYQHG